LTLQEPYKIAQSSIFKEQKDTRTPKNHRTFQPKPKSWMNPHPSRNKDAHWHPATRLTEGHMIRKLKHINPQSSNFSKKNIFRRQPRKNRRRRGPMGPYFCKIYPIGH
jgi:hypothetical protein